MANQDVVERIVSTTRKLAEDPDVPIYYDNLWRTFLTALSGNPKRSEAIDKLVSLAGGDSALLTAAKTRFTKASDMRARAILAEAAKRCTRMTLVAHLLREKSFIPCPFEASHSEPF